MPSTDVATSPQVDLDGGAPTGGGPVDGRRTDTRERLVEAALVLFGEKGYAGTTVAEIEGAVGLRPGAGGLYRHFRSKEALVVAAVAQYRQRVRQVRRQLAESAGPAVDAAGDLSRVLETLADFIAAEQPMVHVGAEAAGLPDAVRRVVAESWDEGYGIFVDLFVRWGHPGDEARLHAVSALGSLTNFAAHLGSWGKEPLDVTLDAYLRAWIGQWAAALRAAPSVS